MNTITFWEYDANGVLHSYNSYDDLGLFLSAKIIGSPAPKIINVDISSGNGKLDYTDYFGEVFFDNRPLSFDFTDIGNPKEFLERYSRLLNLFNGRKMNITLSEDSDFYYIGRITINEWKSNKNIGKVTVDVEAEPFKLKKAETVIYQLIRGNTVICCPNLKMTTIPKITFTTAGAKGTVSLGGQPSSEFTTVCEDEVIFGEGENLLIVTPSAGATLPMGVRIEYQEGGL